jgi:hypothetical protein
MKAKLKGLATVPLIFLMLFSSGLAFSKVTKSVSGVINTFRNYPLKNVKIFSLYSGNTAYSDSAGRFSIESFRNDLLVVTASGFFTTKVEVKKRDFYAVDLIYIDSDFNFLRATQGGFISPGVLRKAIQESYLANKSDYSKYGSIYQLVSSEVYNVKVNGNTIVSTKMRSLDPNPKVLLVVDDKVVSDISFIDPNWVRSVELIDDVRATMYGSMGANGILKITLK